MWLISDRPNLCVDVFWAAKSRWTYNLTELILMLLEIVILELDLGWAQLILV